MAVNVESAEVCRALFEAVKGFSIKELRERYPDQFSAFETRIALSDGLSCIRPHHKGSCSRLERASTLPGVYQVLALDTFVDRGEAVPVLPASGISEEEQAGIQNFVSSLTSNLPH